MSQEKSLSAPDPGGRLRAALTDDQIKILLNVVAEEGLLEAVVDRLRADDPDLADTVRRILDERQPASEAVPSSRKTLEIWNGLWAIWTDRIAEVGDEDGAYVNHDEHWHPPYFDLGGLTDDLEEAADQLSEWIDLAFPLVNEPNLFLESLAEINLNMASYPEWFQPVDDDVTLGPRASLCVLRWTWLGLADQSESGRKMVEAVCGLKTPGQHTELDRDTCCQFFAGLPEGICREIQTYLREPKFREALARLHSVWHRIQDEYESRYDPSAHLQACEKHLDQDWHYGEPLIADAVSREDFAAAERFVELTLSSLLSCSAEESWHPELRLLPTSRYYRSPDDSQAIPRLLDQWENIAARRGKPERVASLRLQRALLTSPEDWAAVLAAFQEYQRHPFQPVVAERLFAEWQQRVAAACAYQASGDEPKTISWIPRLVDSQRDPMAHQETFLEDVEIWVECCQKHVAFFQKNWRSLALLTRNLPRYHEIQARSPVFHSHVVAAALPVSEDMEKSIRHALILLGEKLGRLEVRPVWEAHLHTLVRIPGGSGSYYRDSALWMKALSEVSAASYDLLLGRWKREYRRRRNLWQDMASVGCPGL